VRIDLVTAGPAAGVTDNANKGVHTVILRLGIDIAVRAPHQASLADERGQLIWSGHRFRTTAAALEVLWERLPHDHCPRTSPW